jgi:GTP cyclohydrolase II
MTTATLLFDRPLRTRHGLWHEFLFSFGTSEVVVLGHGSWQEIPRPLIRLHSSCFSAHYLASVECDCREQLSIAYERIASFGAGLVVHLEQDGRGNGHLALMRTAVRANEVGCTQGDAYMSLGYPADARSYEGAVASLYALGIRAATLMTNNPQKIQAFVDGGIDATSLQIIAPDSPEQNLKSYYELKSQEGHDTKPCE